MYKIICDYCSEEYTFSEIKEKPIRCTTCNSSLTHIKAEEIPNTIMNKQRNNSTQEKQETKTTYKLILVYKKTGEKISIPLDKKIVLGRKKYGSDVLGKVPQISRNHCTIENINNQYFVTDNNSLNGTYIVRKHITIECKGNYKQTLKEDDILHLGREPFLIKFENELPKKSLDNRKQNYLCFHENNSEKTKKCNYRCKACGKEFEKKFSVCPECKAMEMMEVI